MIKLRQGHERGHTVLDWLDSYHTFSFDQYFDSEHMGFGPLRVINEDTIAPGAGFPLHPHRDMEIITYVLEGALEHKDSMGNGAVIKPGEVQKMSAGSGVYHSEYNHSQDQPVHLLQIWINPRKRVEPSYEQQQIELVSGQLRLLAGDGGEAPVTLNQDAKLYAFRLCHGESLFHRLTKSGAWLQVASGSLDVSGHRMKGGDGLALVNVDELLIKAVSQAEALLFELAMDG